MNLENRGALGFGRVSGEHGLDAHTIEALGNLLVGQAGLTQGTERTTPRTGIGGETMLVFTETLGLRGSIFLHHVEELESDRVSLHAAIGKDLYSAQFALTHPRQGAGEIFVIELLEYLDEARHHEVEVLVDFLKPAGEIGADSHATSVVARAQEISQPQTPSACV